MQRGSQNDKKHESRKKQETAGLKTTRLERSGMRLKDRRKAGYPFDNRILHFLHNRSSGAFSFEFAVNFGDTFQLPDLQPGDPHETSVEQRTASNRQIAHSDWRKCKPCVEIGPAGNGGGGPLPAIPAPTEHTLLPPIVLLELDGLEIPPTEEIRLYVQEAGDRKF
ncbi:hypothetical protein [Roseibium sp.]|uniref:hypothetical protein n=1 Tax=Roseibium sp. TaxID=1936156 RepID=UPI003A976EF5